MSAFVTGLLLGWAFTYLILRNWDKVVEWWADSHTPDDKP